MTSTNRNPDASVIQVDSQALIKSYNRNMRVVLVFTGAFLGLVIYGFAQGSLSLIWIGIAVLVCLIMLAWTSSFLLKSMFVDKSIETLLRTKVSNA